MEKKVFVSEIKGIDEKEMTMTATISSNAKDRQGEVLEPKGVDLKNYLKNPVVLWAHDYSMPPIGKALWVRRDGDTVVSKVQFAKTPFAQEIFQLFKEGFLKAFSVGFMPKEWEDGDGQKKPYRTYTKWEMLEYSAVPVPANPEAIALAMQKGILKDESLIKAFTAQEAAVEEEVVQEFNHEEVQEEVVKDNGLEELIAENSLLKEQLTLSEKENSELKFKLYDILAKRQKPSEITVEKLESKALEILNGAIRKHQGKID